MHTLKLHVITWGLDIKSDYVIAVEKVEDTATRSYENIIIIRHGEGVNEERSLYAHLKKRIVEEGDNVFAGDIIGTIGSTHNQIAHFRFEMEESNQWLIFRDSELSNNSNYKYYVYNANREHYDSDPLSKEIIDWFNEKKFKF